MSGVVVVVPWRGGCPARERAWQWASALYAARHPGWTVRLAPAPGGGPWIKARAVTPAVGRFAERDDVVVVADADVWCDGLQLAVDAIRDGAPWAIPHHIVHRFAAGATASILGGMSPHPGLELEERPYPGMQGGGYVIARREALLSIPLDPRFEGWGCEDICWAIALHHLIGPAWRGHAPLWHLHHPPQARVTRKRGQPASEDLRRRYLAARDDKTVMRALLDEVIHDSACAPEHAVHADAALQLG